MGAEILTEWKLSCTQAKKMKSLLPEMLTFLGHWSWDISVMVLNTFHNVVGQLKKKEASSMALTAVQRLWSLFDAVRLSLSPQRGPGSSTGSRSCSSGLVWDGLWALLPSWASARSGLGAWSVESGLKMVGKVRGKRVGNVRGKRWET